jgi:small-conductance mechanosensitive channel
MNFVDSLAKLPLFTNSLVDWAIALGIASLALLMLIAIRRSTRVYRDRLKTTAETEFLEIPLEVLSRTTLLLLTVIALVIGSQWLTVGPTTQRILTSALMISLFWQAGIWAAAAVRIWLDRKRRHSLAADRAAASSIGIIGFVLNVVIWSMVLLLTLDNLGIDITALIAGLGIGGIAVALAVQNVLGDLFASLSITLDRPFVIGDFLILGDFMGSVEYIGIKSTRLRSLGGEQIIIGNSDLLGSRVRNYGRMLERRVVFATGITYETDIDQLESIPQLIRGIVEAQQDTRFDRCHFSKHAAASLDFETVYYVLSPDFNRYMDIQQAINLRIHREFQQLGIEFAYPTQKIYLAGQSGNGEVAGEPSQRSAA